MELHRRPSVDDHAVAVSDPEASPENCMPGHMKRGSLQTAVLFERVPLEGYTSMCQQV